MKTKIIDIHPHIISTDTKRYPVAPLGGKRSDWSAEQPTTFEQLIAAMDEAGVDKAAIVHSSTTYGFDNSYVADCVAQQPQRFAGVFSVDMLADDAPEKIRYWVEDRKLGGLRLFTVGSTINNRESSWLDDPRTFPGWECARDLGISVCVQMFKEGVPRLKVILEKFPKVRIVLDHLMKPPIEDGPPYAGSEFLFDLARYENVYLKLTTSQLRSSRKGNATPDTFFPLLVKKFGASRIAWGSNYPVWQESLLEMVTEAKSILAVLPEDQQDWIFHRTAESLYPALADK
ncbi:MAG: amidohydrolase family protein [Deltaproteobacteria bacterium]|nr:amidohydrolase family protein [Deltaproteobacteria bacterium]